MKLGPSSVKRNFITYRCIETYFQTLFSYSIFSGGDESERDSYEAQLGTTHRPMQSFINTMDSLELNYRTVYVYHLVFCSSHSVSQSVTYYIHVNYITLFEVLFGDFRSSRYNRSNQEAMNR